MGWLDSSIAERIAHGTTTGLLRGIGALPSGAITLLRQTPIKCGDISCPKDKGYCRGLEEIGFICKWGWFCWARFEITNKGQRYLRNPYSFTPPKIKMLIEDAIKERNKSYDKN